MPTNDELDEMAAMHDDPVMGKRFEHLHALACDAVDEGLDKGLLGPDGNAATNEEGVLMGISHLGGHSRECGLECLVNDACDCDLPAVLAGLAGQIEEWWAPDQDWPATRRYVDGLREVAGEMARMA